MLSSPLEGLKKAPKVNFGSVTEAYSWLIFFCSQAHPAGRVNFFASKCHPVPGQIQPSISYDEPTPLESQRGPESQLDYFQSIHRFSAAQRGLLSGRGCKSMMKNGIFFNIRITQEGGCTFQASKFKYVNLANAGDFSATRVSHFSKSAL